VGTRAPGAAQPRIVNGVLTSGFASTGALLRGSDAGAAGSWCTGTLIGCGTFLTAAHCLVRDPMPANYKVFLMHGGVAAADEIIVHPDYDPETASADVAVVKLAAPVSGIAPTALNHGGPVPAGTAGTICGFGRTGGLRFDPGLKRVGVVRTAPCAGAFAGGGFLCWDFDAPVGVPGEDSNTCNADSGGPLFVRRDGAVVVAGITSGGMRSDCLAGDHSYDADVHAYRAWIESIADDDLARGTCGDIAPVGSPGAAVQAAAGTLDANAPEQVYEFDVAPGTLLLRVAMNAHDDNESDFDLVVAPGSAPSSSGGCTQDGDGQYAFCEFQSPNPGPWHAVVRHVSGAGPFQVTATTFR
jgi:hypothetical protein